MHTLIPWQRAYVERVIGSIRRECLAHLIVFTNLAPSNPGFVLRLLLPFQFWHASRISAWEGVARTAVNSTAGTFTRLEQVRQLPEPAVRLGE